MLKSSRRLKNFLELLKACLPLEPRRVRVLAFDEARFGLISWYKKRYCPRGLKPPWTVRRKYQWTWLYAAVEPSTGEDFCLYLPALDRGCYAVFLQELGQRYPEDLIVLVQDNAPAHLAKAVEPPDNIRLLSLPPYSPELNPVEHWFMEFRRLLANRLFDSVDALQEALTEVLRLYWKEPALL